MTATRIETVDSRLTVAGQDFCLAAFPAEEQQYLINKARDLEARYQPMLALGVVPTAYNCPDFTVAVLTALWPASTAEEDGAGTWTVCVKTQ